MTPNSFARFPQSRWELRQNLNTACTGFWKFLPNVTRSRMTLIFFLISKAFQVYRTAARTVQKTHVLFYLNSPSFNILLQLKSVLNCSFGASGNMSAIQPLEAFSAYESKRKQNLTKPVYWSKSANPGPKDNSTPTHSWPSTRTSQEDAELFKTRLPNMQEELGKHRKIKKLRGRGDWPYQIFTHTIKPLQLK